VPTAPAVPIRPLVIEVTGVEAFAKQLQEAGCRRVALEEAMLIATKVLECVANQHVNRGVKLDHNLSVFHMLCVRQMVLEKLRCELITRKLCPITLHALCSVFAIVYFSLAASFPLCD
jgi:hypothetical protein